MKNPKRFRCQRKIWSFSYTTMELLFWTWLLLELVAPEAYRIWKGRKNMRNLYYIFPPEKESIRYSENWESVPCTHKNTDYIDLMILSTLSLSITTQNGTWTIKVERSFVLDLSVQNLVQTENLIRETWKMLVYSFSETRKHYYVEETMTSNVQFNIFRWNYLNSRSAFWKVLLRLLIVN